MSPTSGSSHNPNKRRESKLQTTTSEPLTDSFFPTYCKNDWDNHGLVWNSRKLPAYAAGMESRIVAWNGRAAGVVIAGVVVPVFYALLDRELRKDPFPAKGRVRRPPRNTRCRRRRPPIDKYKKNDQWKGPHTMTDGTRYARNRAQHSVGSALYHNAPTSKSRPLAGPPRMLVPGGDGGDRVSNRRENNIRAWGMNRATQRRARDNSGERGTGKCCCG
jgi:hypothetical protein